MIYPLQITVCGGGICGRLFGKSPPRPAKNFRKIGIDKVGRQKVAVLSTAALSASSARKDSKNELVLFLSLFFSRAFCLLFILSV